MAAPRVPITDLPEQTTPTDTDLLVVQNGITTKKMLVGRLTTQSSAAVTDHINDLTAAHAATAVGAQANVAPMTATDVQGQLTQAATRLSQLTNVDNTSDANKPISTATQTALNLKADKSITIATTAPLAGGGDLSAARTLTITDFTSTVRGTVPASGGGAVNYLRADGTWNEPSRVLRSVAAVGSLPSASGNAGAVYFVTDTKTVVVSDGGQWRTMYGDTGMRDVTSLIGSEFATSGSPGIVLRRVNNEVYVAYSVTLVSLAAKPTVGKIFDVPLGFRTSNGPSSNIFESLGYLDVNGAMYVTYQRATGATFQLMPSARFPGTPPYAAAIMRGTTTWTTTDAWPTTLPGTAIGVIP